MVLKKEEVPYLFYYYIHFKLREYTKGKIISWKQATGYLAQWRIPKSLRKIMMKEMEALELIKRTGRAKCMIVGKDGLDFNNVSEVYLSL